MVDTCDKWKEFINGWFFKSYKLTLKEPVLYWDPKVLGICMYIALWRPFKGWLLWHPHLCFTLIACSFWSLKHLVNAYYISWVYISKTIEFSLSRDLHSQTERWWKKKTILIVTRDMETIKIGWHCGERLVATWFAYSSKTPRRSWYLMSARSKLGVDEGKEMV